MTSNPFGARDTLATSSGDTTIFCLKALEKQGLTKLDQLPFSIKVLLESCLRNTDNFIVNEEDVKRLAAWKPGATQTYEVPFKVARVILQDFTGVPCVV